MREKDPVKILKLSPRRMAVLVGMANGKTVDQMATAMGVTFATAKTHIRYVYSLLGAHSPGYAVALGVKRGLITPDQIITDETCPGARVMPNWCRCPCNLCQTGHCAEHWRLEHTCWLCLARRHGDCYGKDCICGCQFEPAKKAVQSGQFAKDLAEDMKDPEFAKTYRETVEWLRSAHGIVVPEPRSEDEELNDPYNLWGPKPSYRCYAARHGQCEPEGADLGCTCSCGHQDPVCACGGREGPNGELSHYESCPQDDPKPLELDETARQKAREAFERALKRRKENR
jgi:DNA-binding CsgD family transcriptional regulator